MRSSKSDVYLSWILDDAKRIESSSGGLFTAIAEYVIENKGVVCGAAYDEEMNVRHILVKNKDGLSNLRGSKYVQSIVGDAYLKVKEYLCNGTLVYFVGTPCQVAGLRSFLRKDYVNLICSDLICHGVPSGELFKAQIKIFERKLRAKIKDFKFRSKKRFGQGYDLQVVTNRKHYFCPELVPYFYGFWTNKTLRECCYRCKYANLNRMGDITLGDFWLVKKYFSDVRTSKGCSLILVNTERGGEVLANIKDKIYLRESVIEDALFGQGQLQYPTLRPVDRNRYTAYKDFENLCLSGELLHISFIYKLKMHLRNIIKTITLFKYWK